MKKIIAALLIGLVATSYGVMNISWYASGGFYFAQNPYEGILGDGSGRSTIAQLMYSPDNIKDNITASRVGDVNDVILATITITEDGIPGDLDDYAFFGESYTGPYSGGYVYALIFQDDNVQVGDWYYSSPIVAVYDIPTYFQEIDMNTDFSGDAINSGPNAHQVGGDKYTLTVNGGTGGGSYAAEQWVTITANEPAAGYEFDRWTGATQCIYFVEDVTFKSVTVIMPAQSIALTATYRNVGAPTKIIGLSGSLNFGSVQVGGTSKRTLTVSNSGNTALTVTNISYPTGFSGTWSGTLGAGASTNVTVTFAPLSVTNYSGTVTVNSDKTSGTNTISVSGAGIAVVALDEALDGAGMSWTTGGTAPWFGQTATTHDGVDAAQSGLITHIQESWIQTTVTGPGTLTYWQKVSSESSYDYLEFYLDGVLQSGRISGEVSWQQKTNSIPSGTHTVKWRYMKDGSVSSGQDAGWVDQVSYVPESPIPKITTQPVSLSKFTGSTATFNATASGGAPLSYQWRKNGTNLTNGSNISGVTTTNLSITSVQTNDAGNFSVVVTNSYGSVTSSVAVLTVADVTVKVTNLMVAQRPGSKLVDITYDVSSTATNAVMVSLSVSNGVVKVNATNLTGAVGVGVATGTGKSMVWSMGTDWNGNVATLSFSVMADDGQTQSVSAVCPVAKTGQTTSYRAGDDGDLETGAAWPNPRFTVITNGTDKTVTDNMTGLEWVQAPHSLPGNSNSTNWNGAIDRCNDLVYAGHSDWRLPSRKELMSLVDYKQYNPALPAGHPFSGVQSSYYWSGTSHAYSTGDAWGVHMGDGFVDFPNNFPNKADGNYVWPVRGGQ